MLLLCLAHAEQAISSGMRVCLHRRAAVGGTGSSCDDLPSAPSPHDKCPHSPGRLGVQGEGEEPCTFAVVGHFCGTIPSRWTFHRVFRAPERRDVAVARARTRRAQVKCSVCITLFGTLFLRPRSGGCNAHASASCACAGAEVRLEQRQPARGQARDHRRRGRAQGGLVPGARLGTPSLHVCGTEARFFFL